MGDAGAIVTNDVQLASRMAMFARHGGLTKGDHNIEDVNSRIDGLQAAILNVKLQHLNAWTMARQAVAALYTKRLTGVRGLTTPAVADGRDHVFHLYVVRHDDRVGLARNLKELGMQTVINYPVALPFLPAYLRLTHQPGDFPIAEHNQSRILSLPIFPEMTEAQIDHITASIRSFAS